MGCFQKLIRMLVAKGFQYEFADAAVYKRR
jgi:hypothetical protein